MAQFKILIGKGLNQRIVTKRPIELRNRSNYIIKKITYFKPDKDIYLFSKREAIRVLRKTDNLDIGEGKVFAYLQVE